MQSFEVSTESLLTGAMLMAPDGVGGTELSVGAAQNTPAASAWADVAMMTNALVRESGAAIDGLVQALQSAANAYAIADQSATTSLGG